MSTPPLDRFGALARRLAVTASRRGLLARLPPGLAATIALADRDGGGQARGQPGEETAARGRDGEAAGEGAEAIEWRRAHESLLTRWA